MSKVIGTMHFGPSTFPEFVGDETAKMEKIGGMDFEIIAEEYDPSHTYNTSDFVVKDEKLYIATSDGITGAWNPALWSATDIGTVLTTLITTGGSISAIGRFLSSWNCTTGQPETQPTTLPYDYITGDYYIIKTVASGTGTNYMPSGTQYTGDASTTPDPGTPAVLSMYRFDGTNWSYLDFGAAFRQFLTNYYDKTTVDALIASNKQVYWVDYDHPDFAAATAARTAGKLVLCNVQDATIGSKILGIATFGNTGYMRFSAPSDRTDIFSLSSTTTQSDVKATMSKRYWYLGSNNTWQIYYDYKNSYPIAERTLPTTPTDTKLPTTKLMHDQDELRIAKADINTSLPTTPANDKVPSTKLMNDQDALKVDKVTNGSYQAYSYSKSNGVTGTITFYAAVTVD